MEKEGGYDSTCLIDIPVLRERGKELSKEILLYSIYINNSRKADDKFIFNITYGAPLDLIVHRKILYSEERVIKEKLINRITRLFLNDKGILESKDNLDIEQH